MLAAQRALLVGSTLLTAPTTMGSTLDPRGLTASASRDNPCDSPQQRLQRLLAVPGSEPYRLNDLLLLRPEADDGLGDSESKEACRNRHVVFFHGDIQVSRSGGDGFTALNTRRDSETLECKVTELKVK